MSSRLTVIFYIVLCLEAGVVLTLLPWWPWHNFFGDWGDNYFLVYAAHAAGLRGLQRVVASGWVRGAVTGLGVLNFVMAFWEIAHFNQTVRALETQANAHQLAAAAPPAATRAEDDAPRAEAASTDLSHHSGPDDARHDSTH